MSGYGRISAYWSQVSSLDHLEDRFELCAKQSSRFGTRWVSLCCKEIVISLRLVAMKKLHFPACEAFQGTFVLCRDSASVYRRAERCLDMIGQPF